MLHSYIHCFYYIIVWSLVSSDLVYSQSSQTGDDCTTKSGGTGQCRSLGDCPHAVTDLFSQGIVPQYCGNAGNDESLFCCPRKFPSKLRFKRVGIKSKAKCKEYGRSAVEDQIFFPGEDISKVLRACPTLSDEIHITAEAKAREFPHMAAIGFDGDNNEKVWLCSGSLISEQFILTSAHCLHSLQYGEPKYIRIGDLNLENFRDDAQPQEYPIATIFKHPNFKPPSYYNDIALIEMDKEARFNGYVAPACLETSSNLTFRKAVHTGWGRYSATVNFEFNPNLLKDTMEHFAHSECNTLYSRGMKLKNGIMDETQVCAGYHTKRDTCMLTAGGPLQIHNEDVGCSYTIVGISSFGKTCGAITSPDVFTRVSAYIEWIEEIVWP